MKIFNKKENIFKLINSNINGVSLEIIIDYLDYLNKVRYKKEIVKEILDELILEKKIVKIEDSYFKIVK
jgi:hypothetical protein